MITLSYRVRFELVLEQKTMAALLQRDNAMRDKAEVLIEILQLGM